MYNMLIKHALCSVQCPLCNMKCTCAGAGEGADPVHGVQCAVCNVLLATGEA